MLLCLKSPFVHTEPSILPIRSGAGRTEEETADVEGGRKEGSVDECTPIFHSLLFTLPQHLMTNVFFRNHLDAERLHIN